MPRRLVASCLVFLAACSSSSTSPPPDPADAGTAEPIDAAPRPGAIVEHGQMVDVETARPVAGLTVSDNGVSTTTDANGAWSLTVPAGSTIQPTVTGPKYSHLFFPDVTATGNDVDFSTVVIPDHATYNLEQMTVTSMDTSKALVHVLAYTTGSCASAVGGTLSVVSPAGASLMYFGSSGVPSASLTSFQDVGHDHPVAVVYNIPPGEELRVTVTHPTCAMAPYPATYHSRTYTGHVRTTAAEPDDVNAAIVVVLQ